MDKPYIICNMLQSLDGRIRADGCPESFYALYNQVYQQYNPDGWICGRITMEDFVGNKKYPRKRTVKRIPKEDFLASNQQKDIGIVVDSIGKLHWNTNKIEGAHIVIATTEKTPSSYLEFLQSMGISYIFCGKSKVDLKLLLKKAQKYFKLKTLFLQGGGKFNGSMLREGLVDQISALLCPAIEGTINTPSIFDMHKKRKPAVMLKLLSVKKHKEGILQIDYKLIK